MRLSRMIEAGFVPALVVALLAITSLCYGARPPVEQPLIREGDFAVQLAKSFNLVTTDDETQAEDRLAAAAIAPRNGWIADYPVTPDILMEIQDSAGEAAKSGRLSMDKETAVQTVQRVSSDMGLPIKVGGARKDYGQAASRREGYERSSQSTGNERRSPYASGSSTVDRAGSADDVPELETYYYEYGPPVISYYCPPWDYAYLYSWVPWPFWWGGLWFGGYFILNDFNVVVYNGHRWHHWHRGYWGRDGHHRYDGKHRLTNHSRDVNGRTTKVDPANRLANVNGARRTGMRLAAAGTQDFQRSGRSIVNREATRSPQSNSRQSAFTGSGSRMASNPISSRGPNSANATNRTSDTGRGAALRPPLPASGRGNSLTGGRAADRISLDRSTPRASSGSLSRNAPPAGFRDGGCYRDGFHGGGGFQNRFPEGGGGFHDSGGMQSSYRGGSGSFHSGGNFQSSFRGGGGSLLGSGGFQGGSRAGGAGRR